MPVEEYVAKAHAEVMDPVQLHLIPVPRRPYVHTTLFHVPVTGIQSAQVLGRAENSSSDNKGRVIHGADPPWR
ncbi:hypothetical protein ASC97_19860 [Rhizobium sp. Root1203]|uniref:hypothetical protein n=1 Tax=Rhizobium sp. Root1203 TaxID=1736427 RepID=UPI00070D4039|nr:hypothetical protein [Rhizobium sp. Root1203]KQV31616.1 hypothetical protein ASC97_19860 [Rhizobium sp. Root1203]